MKVRSCVKLHTESIVSFFFTLHNTETVVLFLLTLLNTETVVFLFTPHNIESRNYSVF